jgi:predicted GNAT superfamily acetyltransferase
LQRNNSAHARLCDSDPMDTSLRDVTVIEQASRAADEAARRVGVTVFILDDREDLEAATRLFGEVWEANGSEPVMTSTLMTALAHGGNYVAGAFRDARLVGASVGFFGQHGGRSYLHSHITAVSPLMQGRSVGFALKQHQRAWALDQGLDEVKWTFDPLVRRNGYFNITKLGAEIVDYHTNFYGSMSDSINRDDETDRCLVSWRVDSRRAIRAAEGRPVDIDVNPNSAHTILAESHQGDPLAAQGSAPTLLAFIPNDIVQIRREDPTRAAAWRQALRHAFLWALEDGYSVTGMTKDGFYILTKGE